ncbi:cytochrome ubiquinol oxidase subunit I [Desulfonema magnum]|uniref:Cytochrome c family protein n=1 Tax=Desulfonema magnum TaxID=45655 RepID=A0A975BFW1_9BACT|nr:cytochrome ubiquinol oxidase subunit I [Desulfonema magnum]QTA84994.1 Cytochrome c family protein [Desulfonema magnum]
MNSNWLLHYPVWDIDFFGGGFLIALIATLHVYVAHFAVGGGLFLVLTEMKGYRENSQPILDYTKKHSKFFMLLTMVFGSVTGVGIWFTISLLNPSVTSELIHTFVFAWATEWVFFAGEIITLFVYFYMFGKMEKKQHLTVGWLYFVFAWLSLFFINGIVAFMLTPGKWLATQNFWDGFFNPSFLPSLCFRTCMAFMLAGIFGFITSIRLKEKAFRETMIRYCMWWLLIPFFFLFEAAYWYATSLPEPQMTMIFSRSPEILPFLKTFVWVFPFIFIIGVIMAVRMSVNVKKVLAFVLLLVGFVYMGSFEWIREAGRRPYLIYGHTYSNSVLAKDADRISQTGILKSARWVKNRKITDINELEAGGEIFRLLCISCHSVGGPVNDILPLTEKFSVFGMDAMLNGMGKINDYMPPFMGNVRERKALAAYIVNGLHKKKDEESPSFSPVPLPVDIPSFDPETDKYVLLAWSSKGIFSVSDTDQYFSLNPPGNEIYVQLVRRGETPERVTEDVEISYRVEQGFETPSDHVDFWKYSKSLMGKEIPQDTGIYGKKTSGTLGYDEEREAYVAKGIPLLPYKHDGTFNPYPLMTIEARDARSGDLLTSTKMVAPVSTEIGCKNCHGGKTDDPAGISSEASQDILAVHDRINRTNLAEMAEKGKPKQCAECHSGKKNLNLSAAIHGFHANYLTDRYGDACMACHPGGEGSFTKWFRGIHNELELDCTNCHGKLEDHALSLLVAEKQARKKGTKRLMKHLRPRAVETVEEILPRKPWINEPDCLNCHADFNAPDTDETEFNQWTNAEDQLYRLRTDDAGMMCAACHGSPHAVYPATNIFGNDRDNIPPLQHQKNPYPVGANKNCKVCHTIDMAEEVHHPNSLNMFRNVR